MAYIGNFLITKLSEDITSSATTMMVTSEDGVKFGAEMIRLYGTELFPYYLVIHSADYQQATLDPNREIVKVTGRNEDTFTIVRGQRGTTASAHSVNDIVQLSIQADDIVSIFKQDPNLVLYLPMDEGTGSFTKDYSGIGNHGTFVGNLTWVDGKFGKCLSFDGSGKYVTCGNGPSLSIANAITLEAWAYPTTSGSLQYILSNDRDCCGSYKGYSLYFDGGFPIFQIWDSNSQPHVLISSINQTINSWNHIVGTFDGNTMKIYVNGQLSNSSSFSGVIGTPPSYNLNIGSMGAYPSYNFVGLIDEVRIYSRALPATEVLDHYLNPYILWHI